jgi:hypothetical protein
MIGESAFYFVSEFVCGFTAQTELVGFPQACAYFPRFLQIVAILFQRMMEYSDVISIYVAFQRLVSTGSGPQASCATTGQTKRKFHSHDTCLGVAASYFALCFPVHPVIFLVHVSCSPRPRMRFRGGNMLLKFVEMTCSAVRVSSKSQISPTPRRWENKTMKRMLRRFSVVQEGQMRARSMQ